MNDFWQKKKKKKKQKNKKTLKKKIKKQKCFLHFFAPTFFHDAHASAVSFFAKFRVAIFLKTLTLTLKIYNYQIAKFRLSYVFGILNLY